jgi:hypothetical protein
LPVGWRKREGCSISSTLTTWPLFALPGEPATRTSWPMRLSSGATIQTPFSFSRRPMMWVLARSTTSTIVPSDGRGGRCRSRAPARGRRAGPSAFPYRAGTGLRPPSSGITKPKPSRWALMRPEMKLEWSVNAILAGGIRAELAVALHRIQAARQHALGFRD